MVLGILEPLFFIVTVIPYMSIFNQLSERLDNIKKKLLGKAILTEENIEEAAREVRIALLEADVALPVAVSLVNDIKAKAIGKEVIGSLKPGEVFIKLLYDELVKLMGEYNTSLDLHTAPPAVILMAGLQGSGKTTTAAKLAHLLQKTHKKTVLLASTDIYRPAAIEQLATLAASISAEFFPSNSSQKPVDIAKQALQHAKTKSIDVIIIDTAGRLHLDEQMMQEIKLLHATVSPIETLFVVDSMTGQDAVNTAKAFNDALALSGVILTKTDGDARGGAALSIRQITGKPIKFIGVGEKIEALEAFHPERIASRILGMGDILTLVEDVERNIDKEKTEKLVKKLKKGKSFDFNDFRNQFAQIRQMGGISSIMDKLPGMGQLPPHIKNQFNDKKLGEIEAIINSMTHKERRFPHLIENTNSRKRRIALGSGTSIQIVNQLLKQFKQMEKMRRKMQKSGGMMNMMRGLSGKFPGGMPNLPF
jgi:signal recognition particle subunit SRP54